MEFSCYSPGHRCGVSRVCGAGEAFPTRHVECTLRAFVEKATKTRRGGNVSFVEYDVPVTLRRRALGGDVRCVVLLFRPLLKYNKWRGGGLNKTSTKPDAADLVVSHKRRASITATGHTALFEFPG